MQMILRALLAMALAASLADVARAEQITIAAIQNGNVNFNLNPQNENIGSSSYANVTSSSINASTTAISSTSQNYSDTDFLFNLSSVVPAGATITGATLTLTATTSSNRLFNAYGFSDTTGNLANDATDAANNSVNNEVTTPAAVSIGTNTFNVTSYFTATPGPNTLDFVGLGFTAFFSSLTYSATLDSRAATSGFPTLTLTYTPAVVPEPASAVMLGTALAGLCLLARKRRFVAKA
jgi:hypothetical protein